VVPFAASGRASGRAVYGVELTKPDLYRPVSEEARAAREFDPTIFAAAPEHYVERLTEYIDCATMLINGIFWSPRFPRLVTRDFASKHWGAGRRPRLRVIGDISCDIGGSIELTVKATSSAEPVYVFEPATGRVRDGWQGDGPVVLAVDKLPAELPREASHSFGEGLVPFIPALASADFTAEHEELDIPLPLKRAVIAHRGKLTEHFRYLNHYLIDES
jgi:alpha-aminoadipic semialdehyde synthase